MSIETVLNVLKRRKLLTIAAVILTALVGVFGITHTAANYSYTSSSLLLPPEISAHTPPGTVDYTNGNPLFYLSALNQSRDILIDALTSKAVQEEVGKRFPGIAYAVVPDALGSGPVIVVTTTGVAGNDTLAASRYLEERLPKLLVELQTKLNISAPALITAHTLTRDSTPTVSHKSQIRTALAMGGGFGLLSLLAIALVDGLRMTRRSQVRGRTVRASSAAADAAETVPARGSRAARARATRPEDRRGHPVKASDASPRSTVKLDSSSPGALPPKSAAGAR